MKRQLSFWGFVVIGALLVFVYPLFRLSHWSSSVEAMALPVAMLVWAGSVVALRLAFTGLYPILRNVMVNWMGVGFVFFSLCTAYELIRILLPTKDHQASLWIIVTGILLCVVSIFIANRFVHRRLEIESNKLIREYHLVQLSDVHIGSRSEQFLARLVKKVNRLKPSVVVITGDLVDTSRVGHSELQSLAQIQAPTLFSVGNHDRYVGLDRLVPILEDLGVRVLRNTTATIGTTDLQFLAIDDAESASHVEKVLPRIESNADCFRVLLYHRPTGFESVVEAGIELMLSGHTHHGQIFPFGWLVRQQFRRHKGLHTLTGDHGDSNLYISPGTGTWGPVMRLGTHNEITSFVLKPSATAS